MNELIVSLVAKSNIYSIVLMQRGKLITKEVGHIDTSNIHSALLATFHRSLKLIRNYMEKDSSCDSVSFELNNSIIIKWLDDFSYTKEEYYDKLEEIHDAMNEIPMTYRYIHTLKPIALNYCNMKYIKKDLNLSVLESESSTDEDEPELELKINKQGSKGLKLESLF